MDQLRIALNLLQRYHFWVLSVVVATVAIGCWATARGALDKMFQANQSTIKREFDSQASLRREPFHPNEQINQRQLEEIQKQADSVQRMWEVLYNRQRDEVLKWPQELDEELRRHVERLKFGDDIPDYLRDRYFNYIERHFPELPKKVKARVLAAGEHGMGGSSRGGRTQFDVGGRFSNEPPGQAGTEGGADDQDYLVEWLDQDRVRQELHWDRRPTSLQIWVTQENLWVYHTLLRIVAETNEAVGADRPSNAAVRVIESLEVGLPAAQASNTTGRIMVPQSASAGGRGPANIDDSGSDVPRGRRFTESPEGPSGGAGLEAGGEFSASEERVQLLSNRYLDENGMPQMVSGESAGPNEFGIEYKRLPVRMVLEMDQRALPRLIAECANQPLQVEVQQVRVNAGSDGSSGYDNLSLSVSGHGGEAQAFSSQSNIAKVIIHGIIYILNEPDTSNLQVAER